MPLQDGDCIAGVDEAGRGPLAGPVIAAAVILNPKISIVGLRDSKKCRETQRVCFFDQICQHALAYGIGRAEVHEIDQFNIFQATLLAMQRAVGQLEISPLRVLIDGTHCPVLSYPSEPVIKGDERVPAIAAASILAKVTRDREMVAMADEYPDYGFEKHKGYGTRQHLDALSRLGPTPIHRLSFRPVKEIL